MLLNHDSDIEATNLKDVRPLHFAAVKGHEDVAAILLEHGAEIDAKTCKGWNPLIAAVEKGFVKTVEVLLQYGADQNFKCQGKTPLEWALISKKQNFKAMIFVLSYTMILNK